MMGGTLILKHVCFKYRKGMEKPKIIKGKYGVLVCSLCGEKVGGTLDFR